MMKPGIVKTLLGITTIQIGGIITFTEGPASWVLIMPLMALAGAYFGLLTLRAEKQYQAEQKSPEPLDE